MNEERNDKLEHSPEQPMEDDEVSLPLSATEEDRTEASLPLSARSEREDYLGGAYTPPPPPKPEWKPIPAEDRFTVRALTEGAMMLAIALLLAFVGNYVPVLNVLGMLLFPLPITILVFRRGLKVGIVAAVALFGLTMTFLPPAQAIYMILQYATLGLSLGYCFRKQKSPLFTLGIAVMIAAVGTMLSLLLTLFMSGLPISSLLTQADTMIQEMLKTTKDSGAMDTRLSAMGLTFEQFAAQAEEFIHKLLPAVLILSAMFMTLICYLVSAKVLRRLRYQIPQLPPFASWRIDWHFTWGLIAGLFLGWFGRQFGLSWMESLGDNIAYIFGAVIFVCGVALVFWLLKYGRLNLVFKVLIVVLLVQMYGISMYLVVLLGVFDALRDLRPWFTARIEKSERLKQNK